MSQAPAGSEHTPPAVCTEAHRLDFHHVSGFRLVAEHTETGHLYAIDVREPDDLSTTWLHHFARHLVDWPGCQDCWDAAAAAEFVTRVLRPHFDQARFGARWRHLPLVTGDELCPACRTADLIDYGVERHARAVAHAG